MKMSLKEVAHAFAHGQEGESYSGNLYTVGPTIYSYGSHFPIASFCRKKRGVILFTSEGYSNTTAKHKSYVLSALSGNDYKIFVVPRVIDVPSWEDHEQNLIFLAYECAKMRTSALRARKHALWKKDEAVRNLSTLREYIKCFQIPVSNLPVDVQTFLKQVKNGLFDNEEEDIFSKRIKEEAKKHREWKKKKEAERKQRLEKSINDFHNHKASSVKIGSFTYLRLSKDGNNVQTSMGVTISASTFKRLWELDKKQSLAGEKLEDVRGISYIISKYNGEFKSGCHTIQREEIDSIAEALELA